LMCYRVAAQQLAEADLDGGRRVGGCLAWREAGARIELSPSRRAAWLPTVERADDACVDSEVVDSFK
jgi:hypothetical protein